MSRITYGGFDTIEEYFEHRKKTKIVTFSPGYCEIDGRKSEVIPKGDDVEIRFKDDGSVVTVSNAEYQARLTKEPIFIRDEGFDLMGCGDNGEFQQAIIDGLKPKT